VWQIRPLVSCAGLHIHNDVLLTKHLGGEPQTEAVVQKLSSIVNKETHSDKNLWDKSCSFDTKNLEDLDLSFFVSIVITGVGLSFFG